LRYEAGWESTFLGPQSAYALISALYEPASALSGNLRTARAVKSANCVGLLPAVVAKLRHGFYLIAITAVLYIVLPRLVAATANTFGLWKLSRQLPIPASLLGYARTLVMGVAVVRLERLRVSFRTHMSQNRRLSPVSNLF